MCSLFCPIAGSSAKPCVHVARFMSGLETLSRPPHGALPRRCAEYSPLKIVEDKVLTDRVKDEFLLVKSMR
jgi:hypothetical protein